MKTLPVALGTVILAAFSVAIPDNGWSDEPLRIEFETFRLEPTSLAAGESFVVHGRAKSTGVKLGSFLLRTAEEVRRDAAIPGFPLYRNGKFYVAEEDTYFLKDNGRHDLDPREKAFSIRISTRGWKPGTYTFALFASCRPSEGPFVAARHDFAVVVKGSRVQVEDLGQTDLAVRRAITGWSVSPTETFPGPSVRVALELGNVSIGGIEITSPFYTAPDETLPGFRYAVSKKKAFYGTHETTRLEDNGWADQDARDGKMMLNLATKDWPHGVHHLQLNILGISGKPIDYRSFAIKLRDRRDPLRVTLEDSCYFAAGTHFEKFIQLRDGTLLCADQWSADGGRSWQAQTGGFGVGGLQLEDGRVIGFDYRCLPLEGATGSYRLERSLSDNNGRRFAKSQANVYVAQAKAAMGHGPHVGPLFMRSLVERTDGSLLALMAGWFHGDDTLCPYGRGRPYSRTYTCESDDLGKTWRYLNTIAYDEIGSEGYNEGSMRRLPNGELLAVLRTGSEKDPACHDNPIMWSVSGDEGRSWSPPQRTGVEGAFPSLAVLSDGLLVLSYGRPGAMLVFSADNGRTWTGPNVVDATPYSGYTDVVEIGPGLLLVGFGTRAFLDPETGARSDQLRMARVRYQRTEPGSR